jgi:hypothetical protein
MGKAPQLTIPLLGKNLIGVVGGNYSSFIRDEVPLAGCNIGLRINLPCNFFKGITAEGPRL